MNEQKQFKFQHLLSFNVLITPFVIRIVYWIGVAVALYFGISGIVEGIRYDSFRVVLVALMFLVGGPIYLRVVCELIIVAFKLLDEMRAVRSALTPMPPPPSDPSATNTP
jgi:hypothetical protein